ncbi:glycosyltransferase, partial [Fulvivirga sp. RKSG066]|uniref:glycosyltransferase n=1 Tax=Fulvivirga aurantia TaxID=2529383 RepID=UPI0012BC8792
NNTKNGHINALKPVIGWTGTHSTLPYLQNIISAIRELEKEIDFTFLIIANKKPDIELDSLQFIKWSKSTEITDLIKTDIGIMPLTDDLWSKGKCGFKALQYLALEKPALVSPIGVNKHIIQEGVTGFFCVSKDDWKNKLRQLLSDHSLRNAMGKRGREFVKKNYSVDSNSINFLSLFE